VSLSLLAESVAVDPTLQTVAALVDTLGVPGLGLVALYAIRRVQRHWDVEESALGLIAGYVARKIEDEKVESQVQRRVRELTPPPQPVEHFREAIASSDNLRDVIGKGRVPR
jgi:hypothetical protein